MNTLASSRLLAAVVLIALLTACSGNDGNAPRQDDLPLDIADAPPAQQVGFKTDVEPLMQAKCNGCHFDGEGAVAPFSLVGEDRVMRFRSAILSALENGSMPAADAPQLTENEKAMFMAWLRGTDYVPVLEINRVALVNHGGWDIQSRNRDKLVEERPAQVDCEKDKGWLVEDDELEVRTEECNYLGITQASLLSIPAGSEVEIKFSHAELNFIDEEKAHVALLISGSIVWEEHIDIPGDGEIYNRKITLANAVQQGDAIDLHLHNHGDNAYTLHEVNLLVEGEIDSDAYCPSFENTFDAIQHVVFEQTGCANSACHGQAKAGNLSLLPGEAYANLLDVPATVSSLDRITPKKPSESFLYQKLSAKTFPGSYNVNGSAMPVGPRTLPAGQLEAIRWWIEAGAPETGSVGDFLGRGEDEIERLLGVCLPEPDATHVVPLTPPPAGEGVQLVMPPHDVGAESEQEICFAAYYDLRDQVPAHYLDESGERIFVSGQETREDPFTHHLVLLDSELKADAVNDPAFGEWVCASDTPRAGDPCDPVIQDSCGGDAWGQCRSRIENKIACTGFGPNDGEASAGRDDDIDGGIDEPGFFRTIP
ncbi:MAG: hypothetical protein ACR2P1_28160, partial [Pseudomonadales bacterium]